MLPFNLTNSCEYGAQYPCLFRPRALLEYSQLTFFQVKIDRSSRTLSIQIGNYMTHLKELALSLTINSLIIRG